MEVMPSESIHKDIRKRLERLPPYLPKPSFSVLVIGSVGSGKSSLLYSMLKDQQKGRTPQFDVLFIWNGAKDANKVFEDFETKKVKVDVFNKQDDEELNEIMDELENLNMERRRENKRPIQSLFVFDDMIQGGMRKAGGGGNAYDKLIVQRRHIGASVITLSQNFKALPPNSRENNISQIIVMRANRSDLKHIAASHNAGCVEEDEFIRMQDAVKARGKYNFLVVDYQEPDINNIFKMNFTTPIGELKD